MHTRSFMLFITSTFLATPSFSGGYVVPIIPAEVSASAETIQPTYRWSGFYAGAFIGHGSFDLKSTSTIHHDAITQGHDAITEEIPEKVTLIPEVTEERVVEVIEHPEVVEEKVISEIEHPAIIEKIPAETKTHPEVTEQVKIRSDKVQTGTESVKVGETKFYDENGNLQPDPEHSSGWRHDPVYEEQPVYEWVPVYEERVVKDAWIEIITPEREIVVKDAWTETITETVVIQAAWTEEIAETVVIEEARTIVEPARTVVVQEAWTEVIREAWSEELTDRLSEDGNIYGLFAGYRHQWRNRFVSGVEAHYGRNSANEFGQGITFGKDTYGVELQAGYALYRALPYVAIGYANILDQDTLTASLGLDYALTDRLFIGAKYTHYDIGNIDNVGGGRNFKADGKMFSLRAGISF